MAHAFTYLELHSTAPQQAKDFYRGLFDWKTTDVQVPAPAPFTYTEIATGEGPAAGLLPQMNEGAPSHWLAYVKVPDLDAATKKARALGATVLRERQEVPGEGWFAVVRDPTGAPLGLFEKNEAR